MIKVYNIKIYDSIVKSSNCAKYLGLIIDDKLSWNNHIDYIIGKCRKVNNVFKFLRGTWWGGYPQTLLNIYKALVRDIFDYASFIYNCSLTKKAISVR